MSHFKASDVYYFKVTSLAHKHTWVWCICVKHTTQLVHAIKGVNKRDVHVAQSAIAQT